VPVLERVTGLADHEETGAAALDRPADRVDERPDEHLGRDRLPHGAGMIPSGPKGLLDRLASCFLDLLDLVDARGAHRDLDHTGHVCVGTHRARQADAVFEGVPIPRRSAHENEDAVEHVMPPPARAGT